MKFIAPLVIWLAAIPAFAQEICLSAEEKKLYDLIMQYRKSKKLKSIPLSAKLTKTAQAHVHDLTDNYAYEVGATCNPHSWSDKGTWTSCCYTSDHKQANCMWIKPDEIAGPEVDGQVLVMQDMLGITQEFNPRFLRRYADLNSVITGAVNKYVDDVKKKSFPNEEEKY